MKSLITSKRLAAVVAGILTVIFNEQLGLSEDSTKEIVGLIMAWVVGDSLKCTVDTYQRRQQEKKPPNDDKQLG